MPRPGGIRIRLNEEQVRSEFADLFTDLRSGPFPDRDHADKGGDAQDDPKRRERAAQAIDTKRLDGKTDRFEKPHLSGADVGMIPRITWFVARNRESSGRLSVAPSSVTIRPSRMVTRRLTRSATSGA